MQQKRLVQLAFLIIFVVLLIRFFPFAVRAAEAAAMGVVEFWWVGLIFVFGFWLFGILKNKK